MNYTLNSGMPAFCKPPKTLLTINLTLRQTFGASKKQWLMRIKLLIIVMTTFLVQVSAASFAQKVTLKERDVSLKSVLLKLRNQTGYDFIYDANLIAGKKVNIDLKDVPLEDMLEVLFVPQKLEYSIKNKFILVKAHEPAFLDQVAAMFTKIDVHGSITDAQGKPLAGASVTVKGSSKVAISGSQGEFKLSSVEENAVIMISYLGYETREVNAKADLGMIRMTEVNGQLQEVSINTGYQSIPKERATGSFSTISKEQIDRPSTNIAQRLIGMTAGMQATLDADGNPRFEIRGQTTLNIGGGNEYPLVVVDGFAIQGDFSTINPNDVESITILKDAAAASIWGAKSANGVIVIITKKAQKGAPLKVGLSAFTKMAKKLDLDYVNPLASSAETVDYETMSFGKWGAQTNPASLDYYYFAWSPATVALNEYRLGYITKTQQDNLLDKYRNLSNKKQISDELLSNPMTQQYNLNLSGGSAKMSNNLSLLYEDNKSNFKGTDNRKYTFNYRTSADIFKWLEFNFSGQVNYNRLNNNGVSLEDIQNISPYEMLRNEDGSLTNISQYYTPVLQREVPTGLFPYADWGYNPIQEIENRKITSEQTNTRIQGGLKFKVLPGLSFETKVQYELLNVTNKKYNNDNTYLVRNLINTSSTWDQSSNVISLNLPKGGILDQDRSKGETYNFRNQVNFDRRFGDKHEINFVAGSEVNNIVTQTFANPTTYGYNDETLSVGAFPNGSGDVLSIPDWMGNDQFFYTYNTFGYNTERYFSLFGNAAYTYNDKYTLSGSVRTDASNLITDDPSYRYAPFWSAGLGWQIGKENFISRISWIDKLNVRATFGYNGNVDRSTSFRPLIGFNANPNAYTGERTASVYSYGNPTLRWEKTATWNLGTDFSLLGGKLYGKLDVYNKSGKDLIADLSIPAANGTTYQRLNNAKMTNKGFELELGTSQQISGNNIVWQGGLNFSYNKNKITKLFVATYDAATMVAGGSGAYIEGQNASTVWRYTYAGMKDKQPMVYGANGALYNFSAYTPGDGRDYLENMGTSVAPYTFGFNSSFKIYDFNLSFIVTGKFGHVFQRKGFNYPVTWTTRVLPNNKFSEVLSGDPSQIVPLPQNVNEPRYYFWDRFDQNLSYLIESASHLRMQELNLSYNLPARLLTKTKISRLQVFAQGNDLFTVVANDAGEDPEYPVGTLKPQPRITMGVKCEF